MEFFLRVIVFFFISSNLVAQNSSSKIELGIPKTTIFLPNDYEGEAQNFDFIQDNKGVLYIGNTIGFLEFNGVNWRSFKPDNDGVPLSFTKNSKGKIFTGGTNFIGYLSINSLGETCFTSLKNLIPKNIKIGFVWNVYCINDIIYFRNDSNILKLNKNRIEVLNTPELIQHLFKVKDTLFINSNKGLYKLVNNKFNFLKGSEKLPSKDIRAIYKNEKEVLHIVTLKNGIFKYYNNKIVAIKNKTNNFLKKNMVFSVLKIDKNTLAFSTFKEGVLFTSSLLNPLYRINEKGNLSNNSVKRIKKDYQGNLWIGSDRGITKMHYPITTTFFSHNEQKIGTIEEITKHKKDLFLGASNGTFKLKKITPNDLLNDNNYAKFEHIKNDNVDNFANFSFDNKMLFGGMNSTKVYENGKTKLVNNFSARKFYKSIHHPNILYMGHNFGFEILSLDEKNNIISQKTIKNLPEIRGVAEDKNKNLWLTSVSNGVFKISFQEGFEKYHVTQFLEKDGLPSLRDNLVYNINNNDVLFTTHKGLFKFDENSQKFVPETRFGEKYAGGKDEFIYAFHFDKNENVWMHSFRKKVAILSKKDSTGNYKIYEKPLKDIGKLQAYEILSEPDKKIVWFGGSDGIARFDYSNIKTEKKNQFHAVISKVTGIKNKILVGGHQFDKTKNTKLKPFEKDIRFEIGVTDYSNIKETVFQYKLEGYDKEWSDWTAEPFKIYTNLNHGNYIFKVKAKNYLEDLSNEDYYSFSILPFWYQKDWFRVLSFFVVALSLIYIANYFSKRKFVKKVYQLELAQKYENEKNEAILQEKERGLQAMIAAQEEERSKIARELHDGVVQQIGSVILKARNFFNASNLSTEKEPVELLNSLENSNQDLRNISHQMMPRALKELGVLSALNDLLEGSLSYANIKYSLEHFNISERLPEKIEVTIYRIVQELINNIIKHSKANEVSVQLFNANNSVILIVEDDGVGFSSSEKKKGIGLLNISSRLDMVNGDVNFEPSPKSGTLVTIKIPLS